MSLLKIGDRLYSMASVEDLKIADILRLKLQLREYDPTLDWGQIKAAMKEMEQLSEAEAEVHPLAELATAVMVWTVRRAAGDDVTLMEAAEVEIGSIDVVSEPGDRKPGKPKGAKKAPKKVAPPASEAPAADET